MLFAPVALLAYASSALAYTVLVPNQNQGWTDDGPQVFTWSRVVTDRENFTVVLTNSDSSLMEFPQALAALVDGNLGNMTLNPPSAGWPAPGVNYRLNIVDSATNLTGILAQSPPFEIEPANPNATTTRTRPITIANTRTQDPASIPTDDTIDVEDKDDLDEEGTASSLVIPAALAAVAAFIPALLL